MASSEPQKPLANQAPARRSPRQARSQYKVELMLEAAMQLLDEGEELKIVTTNAVAARAGVSIGTVYQYFDGKQALLDALVAREMQDMSNKVVGSLKGAPPGAPGERIRQIVRAVVGAYGGRGRVHRLLMEHALTHSSGRRLSPMLTRVTEILSTAGVAAPGQAARKLSPSEAFVLANAMAGVLRALVSGSAPGKQSEVEDALVSLVLGFFAT